jgi:hypothetical protein
MCIYLLPLNIRKSIIYFYVHVRRDEGSDPGGQPFNSPVANEGIGDNE